MAVGDRTQLGGTAYDLRILTTCRVVVGCQQILTISDFAAFIAANGYKIIPVNPSRPGEDYPWRTRLFSH